MEATPTVDPPAEPDLDLDRIFGALSDPTRRRIVSRLAQGDATLSELAEPFDLTMPGLSKHVSVLERAGIVHKWRTGRSRSCRLVPGRLAAADHWIRTQTAFWNDRLDGLEEFLEAEAGTGDGGSAREGRS